MRRSYKVLPILIDLEGVHLDNTMAKANDCRNFAGLHCLKHSDALSRGDLRKGGRAEPRQLMRIMSPPVPRNCSTWPGMEVSTGSSTVMRLSCCLPVRPSARKCSATFVAKD